jgi:hypothetical protein
VDLLICIQVEDEGLIVMFLLALEMEICTHIPQLVQNGLLTML